MITPVGARTGRGVGTFPMVVSVPAPPGLAAGDFLLACVEFYTANPVSAPAGWELYATDDAPGYGPVRYYTKTAAAEEPGSYDWSTAGSSNDGVAVVVAFRGGLGAVQASSGVPSPAGIGTDPVSATAPSLTVPGVVMLATFFASASSVAGGGGLGDPFNRVWTPPAGMTVAAETTGPNNMHVHADYLFGVGNPTGGRTASLDELSAAGTYPSVLSARSFALRDNVAPNAPVLGYPTGHVSIDRTTPQRFNHTFSDDYTDDTESKHAERYRLVGTSMWTTVIVDEPVLFTDFDAGTFVDGDYERQVMSWDSFRVAGPWASSGFFTVTSPPPGPTITAPVNGSTISTPTALLSWLSADPWTSYQVRKLADSGGMPDLDNVLFDSGEVISSGSSLLLSFPVNNRAEHLQVRVRSGLLGLWSNEEDEDWSSVRAQVSYTTPAVPSVTVTPGELNISVSATHPTPSGSEPTVASIGVWRRELPGHDHLEHRAQDLSPLDTFVDEFVSSVQDYEFQVEAVGDNGTSSFSPWVAGAGVPAGAGFGAGFLGGFE